VSAVIRVEYLDESLNIVLGLAGVSLEFELSDPNVHHSMTQLSDEQN